MEQSTDRFVNSAPAPTSAGLRAKLPSGEWLIPGGDTDEAGVRSCAGPDEWGCCPLALAHQPPTCEGAEWFIGDRHNQRVWRLRFLDGTEVCPVAWIDPLRAVHIARHMRTA